MQSWSCGRWLRRAAAPALRTLPAGPGRAGDKLTALMFGREPEDR
jgi:hypothetical protein